MDTDTLSLLQRSNAILLRNLGQRPANEIALSSVTIWEQTLGWHKAILGSSTQRDLADVHANLTARYLPTWRQFAVIPLTEPAILRFEHFMSLRLNVGKNDLRIAAIALENSLTVVTRNLRDFRRVPHLVVEDWSV